MTQKVRSRQERIANKPLMGHYHVRLFREDADLIRRLAEHRGVDFTVELRVVLRKALRQMQETGQLVEIGVAADTAS